MYEEISSGRVQSNKRIQIAVIASIFAATLVVVGVIALNSTNDPTVSLERAQAIADSHESDEVSRIPALKSDLAPSVCAWPVSTLATFSFTPLAPQPGTACENALYEFESSAPNAVKFDNVGARFDGSGYLTLKNSMAVNAFPQSGSSFSVFVTFEIANSLPHGWVPLIHKWSTPNIEFWGIMFVAYQHETRMKFHGRKEPDSVQIASFRVTGRISLGFTWDVTTKVMKLYYNGALIQSAFVGDIHGDGNTPVRIGGWPFNEALFHGTVFSVVFFNDVVPQHAVAGLNDASTCLPCGRIRNWRWVANFNKPGVSCPHVCQSVGMVSEESGGPLYSIGSYTTSVCRGFTGVGMISGYNYIQQLGDYEDRCILPYSGGYYDFVNQVTFECLCKLNGNPPLQWIYAEQLSCDKRCAASNLSPVQASESPVFVNYFPRWSPKAYVCAGTHVLRPGWTVAGSDVDWCLIEYGGASYAKQYDFKCLCY